MIIKNIKNIRKLKIRIKAFFGIVVDTVVLFTMGGTIGTVIYGGKDNAPKEISSSFHEVVTDTNIKPMIAVVDNITIARKLDANDCDELIKVVDDLPDLQYVEIFNAQRLTDEAIEKLNEKGLKEIRLIFNRLDILRTLGSDSPNNRFDLNKFKDKSVIKDVKLSDTIGEEVESFILLNYLTNYDGLDLDFTKYKYLDEMIEEMVNNLYLSDFTTDDILNIIKLSHKEMGYLQYDPYILEKTSNKDYSDYKYNIGLTKMISKYNQESLSIILDPNKYETIDYDTQVKGVCANYSHLFLMLCIKSGIECYEIDGDYISEDGISGPHSWNLIRLGDKYYYVDITMYDSFEITNALMDKFSEKYTDEDYKLICESLFIDLNSQRAQCYHPRTILQSVLEGGLQEPKHDKIFGTENEKAFKFYGFTLAGTAVALATLTVFYNEYIERKRKEEKGAKIS